MEKKGFLQGLKDNPLIRDLGQDNLLKVVGILVLVILVGFFIARPAIQGYIVYSNVEASDYGFADYGSKINDMREELLVKSTSLETCDEYNSRLAGNVEKMAADFMLCQNNLTEKQVALINCENKDFEELNTQIEELTECQAELDTIEIGNDEVVVNAARTICCKEKIDDSSVDSYDISNERIVCRTGGAFSINC
jgi:hypothetical protein